MLVTALLTGCATAPEPQDQAQEKELSERQAQREALQKSFFEALDAMKKGNENTAREQFKSLHKEHPDRTGPLANLGILALEAGDRAQAKAYFDQVLERDPSHAVALNHLGVIAREKGEFARAEGYYREALASRQDYLPAIMNLAILLDIYLGRPGEALPLYEQYQAMAENPSPRLKDWIFDAKNRI